MSLFVNQVTDEWGTSYSLTGLGYGVLVILMLALLVLACFLGGEKKIKTKHLVWFFMIFHWTFRWELLPV